MTTEQERQVALLLKDRILAGMDQPIRQIILYGSRTQGRGRPDSDFDLLVAEPIRWSNATRGSDCERI